MRNIEQRLQEIKKDNRAFRTGSVRSIDAEKRTVELAFSSEAEVARWWGLEILDHSPGAVVLDRLQDGAPLLLIHECEDQLGVVELVSIDADRRGRAVVRFGRSDLAEEIFRDVQDGIRKHVSVGYIIHDAKLTGERDGVDIWTVTKWEPFEISIVPVPADISVGIGRSLENTRIKETSITKETEMTDKHVAAHAAPAVDNAAERNKGTEQERARVRSIMEMGEKFGASDLARDFVTEGKDVGEFQRALLDHVNGKAQRSLSDQTRNADIGLTDKEASQFSIVKLVRALANPNDRAANEDARFEFEASHAAREKYGKDAKGIVIPTDVLARALNTNTSGSFAGDTGGNLIATTLMSESFIDILRNRTTLMQLGTVVGGLVGNIDIPKQVAAAQGYWIGEGDAPDESTLELGKINLTPKTVGARSKITRKMLVQSSMDVEALVRADLAKAMALAIDRAGYYGSGSANQPLGIANHSGINAVAFAGAQPTYAELVEMETQIALDNADVASMAYVGNAAFRGNAKTSLKFPGAAIAQGGTIWEPGNTVNGYRTEVTNQIATGDVFMGNFADLLIAMWGGLQIIVDPYTSSDEGAIKVKVFHDIDFGLRRTQSFCVGRPD